jgi:hypothetical protein
MPAAQEKEVFRGGAPTLKKALLEKTSRKTPIIDFYNDHYGWLDQTDKDYYKMMQSTYQRTYSKLIGCSVTIFLFVMYGQHEKREKW